MKGNPLLRLGLAVLLLAFIFWPVWQLTRSNHVTAASRSAPPSGDQGATNSSVTATLLLQAAPAPTACSIVQNGIVLLTEKNRVAPGIYRLNAAISPDSDLVISADWGDDSTHALRAKVLLQGRDVSAEETFWGAGKSLQDTLPLPDPRRP
jgi:hypothetical protein